MTLSYTVRPISDRTVEIPLRTRFGATGHAVIDEADAHLAALSWYRLANGYVVRTERSSGGKKQMVYLHRRLMAPGPGEVVDHINGDRLDNRRQNLRITDQSGNAQNRGANRGRLLPRNVYAIPSGFKAQVKLDGRPHHLGVFSTVEEADSVASAWRARHMPLSPDAGRLT